jgi:hypothetical protein
LRHNVIYNKEEDRIKEWKKINKKRIMKPLRKVKIKWSSEFAYVIGLVVTDGSLSKDGRHIVFVSKDKEMIGNFMKVLDLQNKIGRHSRGGSVDKKYFRVQFGDVNFYNFLLEIGLMPNKTKIIGEVKIPDKYFFDFLRGHFDGDGSFYSYWDPRWRSSYMFYTVFISASKKHIDWIQKSNFDLLKIKGHMTKSVNDSVYQLRYAKAESLKLLPKMYYDRDIVCLLRKRDKINKALKIIGKKI